jgi:hypothetical protein
VFLEGIGQVVTSLAKIEAGDTTSARSEMEKANASLSKARDLYRGIQSSIRTLERSI